MIFAELTADLLDLRAERRGRSARLFAMVVDAACCCCCSCMGQGSRGGDD